MPPVEERHVFRTVPGGAYIVNGQWVNANGDPIPDPFPPEPVKPKQASSNNSASTEGK